jgi:hypothetical protein
VYELKETGEIVANCHKIPAHHFKKKLLTVQQTVTYLTYLVKLFYAVNSAIKIIFTVSPIRHLKDGAVENQRSKATLILAVHEVIDVFNSCYYFPSYEIFMDELRDYRFYDKNLTHPSALGIEVIWSRFKATFFNPDTLRLINEIDKIKKGMHHRLVDSRSYEIHAFKNTMLSKIEHLQASYPDIDFSEEKDYFETL